MSKTSFGYRGRVLFTVGTLGTIIFRIIMLLWCLPFLVLCVLGVIDKEWGFFILGLIVGLGGSTLVIFSLKDEIVEYIEERCVKRCGYKKGEMIIKELRQGGEVIPCKMDAVIWNIMQELKKKQTKKWNDKELDLAKYADKLYNSYRKF